MSQSPELPSRAGDTLDIRNRYIDIMKANLDAALILLGPESLGRIAKGDLTTALLLLKTTADSTWNLTYKARLEAETNNVAKKAEIGEASQEREKVGGLKAEIEKMRENKETIRVEVEKVKAETERVREEKERMGVEVEKVKAETERVKEEKERMKVEVEKVKAETERAGVEIERVRLETERVREEKERMKVEVEKVIEEKERMKVELEKVRAETERIRAERR